MPSIFTVWLVMGIQGCICFLVGTRNIASLLYLMQGTDEISCHCYLVD